MLNDRKIERITHSGASIYRFVDDGKVIGPSVTSVLSWWSAPQLEAWRQRVGAGEAARITEEAGNNGTALHTAAELYLKGDIDELDAMLKRDRGTRIAFNKVKMVIDQNPGLLDPSARFIEQELYATDIDGKGGGLGGKTDLIAKWGDPPKKRSIIDFKRHRSSLGGRDAERVHKHFLQMSAYSMLFEARTGVRIEDLHVIMVYDDDNFADVRHSVRSKYETKFLEIYEAYCREVLDA